MAKTEDGEKSTLFCSFCGKSQHEVRKLIAGPTVFICDECVELCMDIIREEHKTAFQGSRWSADASRHQRCAGRICDWSGARQAHARRSRSQSLTNAWLMLARLAMWKFPSQTSCLLAQPAVARRCSRRHSRGCSMCLLPWPMPQR